MLFKTHFKLNSSPCTFGTHRRVQLKKLHLHTPHTVESGINGFSYTSCHMLNQV